MNKLKKTDRITAYLLSALILSLAILLVTLPKSDFSENENRSLAEKPTLTLTTLSDGSFMTDLSDYLIDHFPFRDFFVGLCTRVKLFCGYREINGVYLGSDGSLIDRYELPENDTRFVKAVTSMADKTDVPVTLMLVPTAVTIYPEKLPANTSASAQAAVIDDLYAQITASCPNCTAVDVLSELTANKSEPLFYRTDHHWTTAGAYIGYLAYCKALDLEPLPLSDYTSETFSDFYGTLYSRFGDYSVNPDSLTLYTLPNQSLTVTYGDTGEVSDSLYNRDYLEKRDKYSCFLNNLHDLVTIENPDALSDDTLLVVKDSYANSLLPFLAAHYRTIYVIDPRYWRTGISSFAAEHEISSILVLYNLGTLDEDAGIGAIY